MPLAFGETRPRRYDADTWRRAEQMLDDGCSYSEVSRTLGPSVQSIAAHFPGRGWTPEQSNELRRAIYGMGELREYPHGSRISLPRSLPGSDCRCQPCSGRGNDGHGMTHCAECCFGTGVDADPGCHIHGDPSLSANPDADHA